MMRKEYARGTVEIQRFRSSMEEEVTGNSIGTRTVPTDP